MITLISEVKSHHVRYLSRRLRSSLPCPLAFPLDPQPTADNLADIRDTVSGRRM